MSAARWARLAATLAEAGHAVTVDERPYSELVYGRVQHGVSRSVTMRLDDGYLVEIGDAWWRKNPDVWIGWQVDLVAADGIVIRSFPRTKKRGEVAGRVAAARQDRKAGAR